MSGQRLHFSVLTKRSAASGDENGQATDWVLLGLISELLLQIKRIIQVLLMEKLKRSRKMMILTHWMLLWLM